ncbi:MAG: hypothetical protein JO316_21310 [Abitibacteriaceae bacterium]|nr:hypothetical protein [Abditibacteriaceae bacterium]MBV9867901.1 hypothetical protein [Abditibacteriaceae bacterium]
MRYLFYAVDGLGLGHVTRLLALARAVRRQCPAAEILLLTASEASHVIYREGFAALKVPSRAAASTGRLRHGSFVRLSQSVVWNAVTAFDPHCLIVDTFAAGALHELLPLLRWPLRKVFVFRAQRPERANDTFLQNTLRLYDLILVPHAPDTEEIPTPDGIPTVWTGPMLLRDREELLDRTTARAQLGLPLEGEIGLLTLGGGGEPETAVARKQLNCAIEGAGSEMLWVEMEGPLLRPPANATSAKPAEVTSTEVEQGSSVSATSPPLAQPQWRVLRDVYPAMPYLNAFDCAVASVGYNTTHELQAAGVPTVLWPFTRDVDDQQQRAQNLAQAGRALCVGEGAGMDNQAGVTADNERVIELTAAIRDLMQPATRERLRQAMAAAMPRTDAETGQAWRNGADIGAEAILKLLGA